MEEDIYIRFLRQYYEEHGTINDIPYKFVAMFEGERLCVYDFLKNIRNRHRAYIGEGKIMNGYNTKLSLARYQALDEMGYDWNSNPLKTKETVKTEPEILYLRSHYAEFGTINDILYGTEVNFNGKVLKIGDYLKTVRERHAYYVKKEDKKYATSEVFVARYRLLDEMDFDWEPHKRIPQKQIQNDICLKYLREHYLAYGTIDDITQKDIVEYDNQKIEIGKFLSHSRSNYRRYMAGNVVDSCASKVMLERYKALEQMNFIWEPQAYKASINSEQDPYIEYLHYYYEKYGTINDIKSRFVTVFNGQSLNIGFFLSRMRSNYRRYQSGEVSHHYGSKLSLQRYRLLEEMNFDFAPEKKETIQEIAEKHGLSVESLLKLYRKFDGDIDKALKIALSKSQTQHKKESRTDEQYTLEHLLKFFDIDFESLVQFLNHRKGEKKNSSDQVLRYKDMTLREFCVQNGYNYDVLVRAVRLKINVGCDESLVSLVNRSIIELNTQGQKRPSNWIYTKYGNEVLVKHMLLFIGFNSDSILNDMSKNVIGLDEAFMKASFNRYSKNQFRYLEGIYRDYVDFYHKLSSDEDCDSQSFSEKMVTKAGDLISYYHLNQDEFNAIRESFFCYTDAVYKFHLCDVGFEKDNDKRVEKILTYRLDSDDIEEAFFIPLKFDSKVLIGRDSNLYQRRLLLKNLTVSWNDLGQEERENKIIQYGLTDEEVYYVDATRKNIDRVKAMVLEKIKK